MSYERILVGIDFSRESDVAVREARALAQATGAELLLFHATSTEGSNDDQTRWHESATARLDTMRARMAEDGVHALEAVYRGHPDTGLCTAARELGADLIVVGTHGRTGLRWFMLGSVAERVIRLADVDVLVARDGRASRDGYHRILVPTDFTPSSERAFEQAQALAAPDAVIDVVHFYKRYPDAEIYDSARRIAGLKLDEESMRQIAEAGQSFIGEQRADGPRVRFYAVADMPIPGVVHWLEREPHDLVALGSHGRRGVRHLVLGSVAEAVARRSPCSVLVARGTPET